MSKFYDLFPLTSYDITKDGRKNLDYVTNIFLRFGLLSEVKNNAFGYYDYLVREQDTPENLADRYYGDPEYHWIILLMNDIVNPLFDWPLRSDAFNRYIEDKYAAAAASQTHHYTQTIKRTDMNTDTYNEIIMEIDLTAYTVLPASSLEVETLSDGRSIQVLITRTAVDCLTWEIDSNDKKRNIKLLKKENLSQVLSEFQNLLSKSGVKSITSRREVR